MHVRTRVALVAALAATAACTGDAGLPSGPEVGAPSFVIADGARSGPVPGFYFLPPMVAAPSFSGTFDATQRPTVTICELSGPVCGPVLETFTTAGHGPRSVRVDASDEHYIVNWKTSKSLDPNRFYRITVSVDGFVLGFADVDVIAKGSDRRSVDTTRYVVVHPPQTLPIKFRIEQGIVRQVIVQPDSASVLPGGTQPFTATLIGLNGLPITGPAVSWTSSAPAVATVDGAGLATGVSPGVATITAAVGPVSDAATLTVINPNTPPVASPDTFDAIGNVTVPVAAPGVLTNVVDAEGGVSAVPGTVATAQGGTATIQADGSFSYLSAPGFTGVDSFAYAATDGQDTVSSTITMVVPTRVWYVDNAGAAPGDGRDASPFVTLAAAGAASAPGETIFLRAGDGTTTGLDAGFTLQAGQALTGQGVAADVTVLLNGQTVPLLAAGARPTITRAGAGTTLQLATNNVVQGLNVTSSQGAGIAGSGFGTFAAQNVAVSAVLGPALELTGGTAAAAFDGLTSLASPTDGIRLQGVAGSVTAPSGSVTGAADAGVRVAGGDATVAYGGAVSVTDGRSAWITGRTGGSVTLSGNLGDTGGGILVENNGGGTVSFTGASKNLSTGASNAVTLRDNAGASVVFAGGGLSASSTATAFLAENGGTVTVTGANNSASSAGGVAVRVEDATIGASGITFRAVSANGGPNGIVLVNSGALGGFQVTGDGVNAGSGGTIQNVAGADGARAGNGVFLENARAVTLSFVTIRDAANHAIRGIDVAGFTLRRARVEGANGSSAAAGEASLAFTGLTGTALIDQSNIEGGRTDNLRVENAGGTLDRLTLSGNTFGGNSAADGDDGVALVATGAAVLNVTAQGNTFTASRAEHFDLALSGGADGDLVFDGNTLANAHPSPLTGSSLVLAAGAGAGTTLTYSITGNTLRGASGTALTVVKGIGAGPFSGVIEGNVIGQAGVANSGSLQGSGIDVASLNGGTHTVAIRGNEVRQFNNFGILINAGNDAAGTGAVNATVTGNTVTEPGTSGFPTNGFHLNAGTNTGDTQQVCLQLGGAGALANNLAGSGANGGTDFRLRQRFLTTVRLPGYAGAANGNAAVVAFVQGQNAPATGAAANTVSSGGGGFVGGAACPQP